MKKFLVTLFVYINLTTTTAHSMLLNSALRTHARKNFTRKRMYCHRPSTESLCEELIKTLKKQDKIVKKLLQSKHTRELTHYPGHTYPLERYKIMSKMEESRRLFHKLEEETKSWYEREYGR